MTSSLWAVAIYRTALGVPRGIISPDPPGPPCDTCLKHCPQILLLLRKFQATERKLWSLLTLATVDSYPHPPFSNPTVAGEGVVAGEVAGAGEGVVAGEVAGAGEDVVA